MDLEFSITESITRNSAGHLVKIHYQFEEFSYENTSTGITSKREKRSRIYDTIITREHYNFLIKNIRNPLSFENFLRILSPFFIGYYQNDELYQAFRILDQDHSQTINIDELTNFLPILNEYATIEALKDYIKKIDIDTDGKLNYDEFRTLILKGIGRDIVCNHI